MKLKLFVVLSIALLLVAGCGNPADGGTENVPGDEVSNITPEPTPPPNTLPPYVMVNGYLYCISPIDRVELDEDNLLGTITKILPSELPEKDLECNYLSEDTSVYRNPENNMVIYLRNQQERTKKYNYYQGVPLLAKVDGEMYWISFADSVDINEENLIGTIEVSNTSYSSIPEKDMESNCLRKGTQIYCEPEDDKILYFRYYYSDDFYVSYKGEVLTDNDTTTPAPTKAVPTRIVTNTPTLTLTPLPTIVHASFQGKLEPTVQIKEEFSEESRFQLWEWRDYDSDTVGGILYRLPPSEFDVDSDGNVYICDPANNKIDIYDNEGEWKETISCIATEFTTSLWDMSSYNDCYISSPWSVTSDGRICMVLGKLNNDGMVISDSFYYIDSYTKELVEVPEIRLPEIPPGYNSKIFAFKNFMRFDIQGNIYLDKGNAYSAEGVPLNTEMSYVSYEYAGRTDTPQWRLRDAQGNIITYERKSILGKTQYWLSHSDGESPLVLELHAKEDFSCYCDIVGMDKNGLLYFVHQQGEKNAKVYVYTFSFDTGEFLCYQIEPCILNDVSVALFTIDIDEDGNIYQLQADENELRILKYKLP